MAKSDCWHQCICKCHGRCGVEWVHMVPTCSDADEYQTLCPSCSAAGHTVRARKPRPVISGDVCESTLPREVSIYLETADRHAITVEES
jgi:hypothetical protein